MILTKVSQLYCETNSVDFRLGQTLVSFICYLSTLYGVLDYAFSQTPLSLNNIAIVIINFPVRNTNRTYLWYTMVHMHTWILRVAKLRKIY